MQTMPIVTNLPPTITREVGRVITLWAALDLILSQAVYAALGVGPKGGRLAVIEPRAIDRIEVIKKILSTRQFEPRSPRWKECREDTKAAAKIRDALAHGVWTKKNENYLLRFTKGAWPRAQGVKLDMKIRPRSLYVKTETLRVLSQNIRGLIDHAGNLREQIEAAFPPSQDRCP
ncbi:MAG: hypothetical protein ACT4N4_05935 [Rhodospirillales bacterium]